MQRNKFFVLGMLALAFGLVVFGCASSGGVKNKKNPEFSSFEIGDKKIDLYALLESSEESPDNWMLLSINVVKTSNDGKYTAKGN